MNTELDKIVKLLKENKRIVIVGHTNPDGDAVNSAYALAYALETIGNKPYVVLENYNSKYNVTDGQKFLYKDDLNKLDFDLIVSVDTGSVDRLGSNTSNFYAEANKSICIDHHASNTFFGKYNYVFTESSSTCEVMYEIISKLTFINKNIGSCIYAGLIFDTAGFFHNSTSSKTLDIASKLLEMEIPFNKIYNQLMYSKTVSEAKIYSLALQNIVIDTHNKLAYTKILQNDFKTLNATSQDLDGIVGFLLNIDDIEVAILAYEREDSLIKISMRSKHTNVSEIAQIFGGGGHKLAAGCTLTTNINDAVQIMLNEIKNSR